MPTTNINLRPSKGLGFGAGRASITSATGTAIVIRLGPGKGLALAGVPLHLSNTGVSSNAVTVNLRPSKGLALGRQQLDVVQGTWVGLSAVRQIGLNVGILKVTPAVPATGGMYAYDALDNLRRVFAWAYDPATNAWSTRLYVYVWSDAANAWVQTRDIPGIR